MMDHPFERHVKKKGSKLRLSPQTDAWNKLHHRLEKRRRRTKVHRLWSLAACVLFMIIIGYGLLGITHQKSAMVSIVGEPLATAQPKANLDVHQLKSIYATTQVKN